MGDLSPVILSAFVVDSSRCLSKTTLTGLCVSLRVFLRYLWRERVTSTDLSAYIEQPHKYALQLCKILAQMIAIPGVS